MHTEGAAPFLQPLFPIPPNPNPASHPTTLQGAAGEAELAGLAGCPGWGDGFRGPTAGAHGQPRAPAAQEGKQRETTGP